MTTVPPSQDPSLVKRDTVPVKADTQNKDGIGYVTPRTPNDDGGYVPPVREPDTRTVINPRFAIRGFSLPTGTKASL